jgi:hypothetical protein
MFETPTDTLKGGHRTQSGGAESCEDGIWSSWIRLILSGRHARPRKGDLFIDRPDPYQPNPFCFSAARRQSCVHEQLITLRRAAEKQKGGYYWRIVSINRPPLRGLGTASSRTWIRIAACPVFPHTCKDASGVQRPRAHSARALMRQNGLPEATCRCASTAASVRRVRRRGCRNGKFVICSKLGILN